ncbi:MAG: hypothetical protein AAF549_01165 [Pseudomonadota bacterium]
MSGLERVEVSPVEDFGSKATIYSFDDAKLLKDNPKLAEKAAEIGLNAQATIQFIKQSLMAQEGKSESQTDKMTTQAQVRTLIAKPTPNILDQNTVTNKRSKQGIFSTRYDPKIGPLVI